MLSSSAIAAPAFVEAALQERFEQRVEIGDRVLVLRRGRTDDPQVLLSVAGTDAAGRVSLFPEEGGDVLCLAETGEEEGAGTPGSQRRRRRRLPAGVVTMGQLLGTLADSRLRYVLAVVATIVLVSALFLHFFADMSILTAVYFTVSTITTIGYGDVTLINAPPPVLVYGIFLELVGAAVIAMFFAVITDTLVGTRLRQALGGLHRNMDDHFVVCGLGNIGHRVAEQIHRMHYPVVAMELNENQKSIAPVRRSGVPVLIGDAREVANLQKLEVGRARCLIVCTDDDISNLEIALTVRTLNPELKVVLQLHDPDLAARVQRAIGVGISRSTSGLAAPAFVSAALGHRVISTLPVGDRTLVVARATVVEGSAAAGKNVEWLLDGPYARVLMVRRGDAETWRPGPRGRARGRRRIGHGEHPQGARRDPPPDGGRQELAADLGHRLRRLDEARLADVVTLLLVQTAASMTRAERVVRGARPQQVAQVGLVEREQAGAQPPSAVSRTRSQVVAERLGDAR